MSPSIFCSFLVYGGGKILIINILQTPLVKQSIIKMRRFLFLWGVVLSAFLLSCSKEAPLQSNEVEETVYQKVGRMHNEGLDYVLDYIKQNKRSIMTRSGQPLSKDDILLMVEPAVKEFIRTSSESGRFGPVTRVSEDELSFDFSGFNISEVRESLNDASKDYFDKFISILDSNNEYELRLKSMTGLVQEISDDKSIDHFSKNALLYTIEIGKSSFEYWKESYQKWYQTLNSYDVPNTRLTRFIHAEGRVYDELGRKFPGVAVVIKGTYPARSILTDSEGWFSMSINPDVTLSFERQGYQHFEIEAPDFQRGAVEVQLFPIDYEGYFRRVVEADFIAGAGAVLSGVEIPQVIGGVALGMSAVEGLVHCLDLIW